MALMALPIYAAEAFLVPMYTPQPAFPVELVKARYAVSSVGCFHRPVRDKGEFLARNCSASSLGSKVVGAQSRRHRGMHLHSKRVDGNEVSKHPSTLLAKV